MIGLPNADAFFFPLRVIQLLRLCDHRHVPALTNLEVLRKPFSATMESEGLYEGASRICTHLKYTFDSLIMPPRTSDRIDIVLVLLTIPISSRS